MGYLTESQLDNIIDLPLALSATALNMGDWLVIGSVTIQQPMRLTCRMLELQVLTSSVTVADLDATNLLYGNLGIVYVVMQLGYTPGTTVASGGVDSLVATSLGYFNRNLAAPAVVVAPGTYTWLVVNNTQPSSASAPAVDPSVSIDVQVAVTGSARLELNYT